MENTQQITETVIALFKGADDRDWDKVKNTLAEKVLLDYSAMGSPAAELTPGQIITAWKGLLPGFDSTHHQPAGFTVKQDGDTATVRYSAKADHFIGSDGWTVEANYDTNLIHTANGWKITMHKINDVKQSGDTTLPAKAMEIAKHKL
jgi:hypothetical protein